MDDETHDPDGGRPDHDTGVNGRSSDRGDPRVVEEGESDVDESMITGESRPVSKEPSDEVIGGTINGDGSLRVRISATGDETALTGIMRLVE